MRVTRDNRRGKHDKSNAFFFADRRRPALQIATRPRRDDILHETASAVASCPLRRSCASNGVDITRFAQIPWDLLDVPAEARVHDAAPLAEGEVRDELRVTDLESDGFRAAPSAQSRSRRWQWPPVGAWDAKRLRFRAEHRGSHDGGG